MFDRTIGVITHGKSLRTGAQPKCFGTGTPDAQGAGPDDFSD